jgi:hypothetical protein
VVTGLGVQGSLTGPELESSSPAVEELCHGQKVSTIILCFFFCHFYLYILVQLQAPIAALDSLSHLLPRSGYLLLFGTFCKMDSLFYFIN